MKRKSDDDLIKNLHERLKPREEKENKQKSIKRKSKDAVLIKRDALYYKKTTAEIEMDKRKPKG